MFTNCESNAAYLASALCEALKDNDEAIFAYDAKPEAIETEARDGFIPYTSGGWHICLPAALSYCRSSGHAPAPLQGAIREGERFIADAWAERFPERPGLIDCICDESCEWQAEAEEWESEAWINDEDCYFWKAQVMFLGPLDQGNETGRAEVYIDAYLNTDLNYGRDYIDWAGGNQTHGNFKRTIPADQFAAMTEDDLDAIVQEAVESLP